MEASQTPPNQDPQNQTPAGDGTPPNIPTPDTSMSTDDMLRKLIEDQAAYRQEITALREEVQRAQALTAVQPAASVVPMTEEEKLAARLKAVADAAFYCPGCGRLYNYMRECTGHATAGHPPIEVVSTDEITGGDPAQHTAAPAAA